MNGTLSFCEWKFSRVGGVVRTLKPYLMQKGGRQRLPLPTLQCCVYLFYNYVADGKNVPKYL